MGIKLIGFYIRLPPTLSEGGLRVCRVKDHDIPRRQKEGDEDLLFQSLILIGSVRLDGKLVAGGELT
uniref:Uncharacterized protein n=1 Tax=Heterorhabditis bacteriophora TaxID=37862 RepID=A0A1I7WGD9_HETBA